MKRKYGAGGGQEDSSRSLYGAPHLESTMMIDTGGVKTGDDCIGQLSTIPINASLSSGTRLFQYNRFFWNRDLFTFNYNNCATIIILSWYNGPEQISHTMFFPVFLPQTALTTFQNLNSGVTYDPATKTRLINDLLYYLNGMWVPNQSTRGPPPFLYALPPNIGPVQMPPSFLCYHWKGFLINPDNRFDFPFFQSGSNPPPLKWVAIGSNQNIALIKNPDYWTPAEGSPVTDYDCAFQFVNPYEGWTISEGNPTGQIQFPVDAPFNVGKVGGQIGMVPPVYKNVGNSNHKGWCGRGAFSIGFAQNDDQDNFGAYTDIYGEYSNPVLQDLWQNYTTFIDQEPGIKMDGLEWVEFVSGHYLSQYCVIAYFIPNFLPSRYVTITSSILSRDQKLIMISNSPVLSRPNNVGIQFLTLDQVRTWQDVTLSGILPSNRTQGNIGGRTNGNDDLPVLNMNPFYSIQSLDVGISDEWDTPIQNFRSPQNSFILKFEPYFDTVAPNGSLGERYSGDYVCSYVSGENSFVLDDSGGLTANVTSFTIPAWLAALNPLNSVSVPPPSEQPLLAPFSTYNSAPFYMLFAFGESTYRISASVSLPAEFSPSMPYSGNIIHFGRVIGY